METVPSAPLPEEAMPGPALIFISRDERFASWRPALADVLPGMELRHWPEDKERRAGVAYAIAWHPPPGALARFPDLKAVFSVGAGVEHIFADPRLPPDLPVIRLVDDTLTEQMSEYVLLHVLRHHRRQPEYDAQQAERLWRPLAQPRATQRAVGILGLGVLGLDAARKLRGLGFRVAGWSRRRKHEPGIDCYAGREELPAFLARSEIAVCLLPLTPETRGLLNAGTLAHLPEGAALINAARGTIVEESALLNALDSGRLGAATVDVFSEEPLPAEHPFWRHPRVTVTPHIAAVTDPVSAARIIAANIARIESGLAPLYRADPDKGY